jgi:hypothetical protein
VTEADIWRAAKLLLDTKGAEAPAAAQERIAALRAKGDQSGVQVWTTIAEAIAFLGADGAPAAKDRVH